MNGFDVPKIYLADFTLFNNALNLHRKKFAVIDGKQRMLAILDFFDGGFALGRDFEYLEDPNLNLAGLSYQDLVSNFPRVARRFENYSLTVMSVVTDDESRINELFVRLNTSKPLTGSELRNAMTGRVPELIRDIVAHDFFAAKIKFGTGRSQDKNAAGKLLLIEHRGALVDTKKAHLDRLVEEAERHDDQARPSDPDLIDTTALVDEAVEQTENPDIRRSAERVCANLDQLTPIFLDKDPLLTQQAQIPIIYWLVRNLESPELALVRPFLGSFR